jgi:hypothetical protein
MHYYITVVVAPEDEGGRGMCMMVLLRAADEKRFLRDSPVLQDVVNPLCGREEISSPQRAERGQLVLVNVSISTLTIVKPVYLQGTQRPRATCLRVIQEVLALSSPLHSHPQHTPRVSRNLLTQVTSHSAIPNLSPLLHAGADAGADPAAPDPFSPPDSAQQQRAAQTRVGAAAQRPAGGRGQQATGS